jgi:flagellar hook-length control protein FliK
VNYPNERVVSCLDGTQIYIKINQTNQSDIGKPKSTNQTKAPVNSFDQILAMFNIARSPESDEQKAASSLQNGTDKTGSDKIDPTNIRPEDWWELDAILTSLVAGIQQVPYSPTILQDPPIGNSSEGESQPPDASMVLSPTQQVTTDASKSLDQWLQKVEGYNQTSTLDLGSLMQGLTQLFAEIQSQEKQKSFEVPSDIGDKIQMILDETKTGNNINVRTPYNSPSNKNELLLDDIKHDITLESKPRMSLDKNQVIFSSFHDLGTNIHEGNQFVRDPLTQQMEDPTKSNVLTLMGNHQLQGPDSSNVPKNVPPSPLLQVSEFAPEVSEWISRYMRITNGQSGGTEAKFSLYPEHLGHIEVKITSQQGQVTAQIVTDTLLAKESLEGQLYQLKEALQLHGLLVKKLDIVQQTPVSMDSNQANLSFSHGDSSSSHEQRTSSEQELSKKQNDADQNDLEIEMLSITYGGATPKTASSIDFTA